MKIGFRNWNSLKAKLLVPTLAIVVLGMAVLTVVSYEASKSALEDAIQEELRQSSSMLAGQVDSWVQDLARDTDMAASRDVMAECVNPMALDRAQALAKATRALVKMQGNYGYYETVAVAGADGKVAAASSPQAVGIDVTGRDYYKKAMAGQANVSSAMKSKATGNPVFAVAAPIRVNGAIRGIFMAVVDLQAFSALYINSLKFGNKGYAYMLAPDGTVLAHPDKSMIMSTAMAEMPFVKEMLAKKNGIEFYEYKGNPKIVGFTEVPATGWIVAGGADLDDIFAPVAGIRNLNIAVAAAAVLAAGLVIFLLVGSVVKAVQKGVEFARNIQAGDVSQRVDMDRADEVGVLAKALNAMADSLEEKIRLAESIAANDLTRRVKLASDKDQLGLALGKMTDNLNTILAQIADASAQVAVGAGQVSDSSQSLSQGATEQAASIEEISSSMTEIGSQSKNNAENAASASQLSLNAKSAAAKGSDEMRRMVEAMDDINDSSQAISKIIKVIDEIAFQTNLLALNAAVEAARAGKYGKGFAVVAEEVRSLAARSAKAAQETAELIEGSVKKVENGNSMAQQTAESLGGIVDAVTKVADLVAEIAAASGEQAEGVSQIGQGVTQIDQVTQQNTANAEETASAAEELSGQSVRLKQLIGMFKLEGMDSGSFARVDAPKAAKPAKGEENGAWGGGGARPIPQETRPEEIIALDDAEFGRY